MKRTILRILLTAIFCFLPVPALLWSGPSAPESFLSLSVQAETVQGGTLALYIDSPDRGVREAAAELLDDSGKTVLGFAAFRLPGGEGESGGESWAALAGIPSTFAPGNYTLKIRVGLGTRTTDYERTVRVAARDFVQEDIPLNQAMSELRIEPDPRKDEEARELYRLLGSFDAVAVFHTGTFSHPVGDFRETSFFGDRRTYHYSDGGKAGAVHHGIDYATPRGTPVHASGAGRVAMAKNRIMTGYTVVLEHLPGVFSLYYHLDGITVREGEVVEAGRRIGESGATGLITGPHLHWEIRAAGNAVEPKILLARPLLDKNAFSSIMGDNSQKGR